MDENKSNQELVRDLQANDNEGMGEERIRNGSILYSEKCIRRHIIGCELVTKSTVEKPWR